LRQKNILYIGLKALKLIRGGSETESSTVISSCWTLAMSTISLGDVLLRQLGAPPAATGVNLYP
jgi:hypothetical protein